VTAEEQKYDCRKLTGQMQIRILQVRGYDSRKKSSMAARGMQSVTTPIFGGTKEGTDPDGQYRKDLAQLEAYNQQLAAKKCKTFDLQAELASTTNLTPRRATPRKLATSAGRRSCSMARWRSGVNVGTR
jgi:pectin methylesterase-like acyl-CoA thioesterase